MGGTSYDVAGYEEFRRRSRPQDPELSPHPVPSLGNIAVGRVAFSYRGPGDVAKMVDGVSGASRNRRGHADPEDLIDHLPTSLDPVDRDPFRRAADAALADLPPAMYGPRRGVPRGF